MSNQPLDYEAKPTTPSRWRDCFRGLEACTVSIVAILILLANWAASYAYQAVGYRIEYSIYIDMLHSAIIYVAMPLFLVAPWAALSVRKNPRGRRDLLPVAWILIGAQAIFWTVAIIFVFSR